MNIEYVGRGYRLDDLVRSFTEDKLSKVEKFLYEPVDARVTLGVVKHRHIAEIHVAHRMGALQATVEAPEMHDAIHGAVGKLEKQARRSHKKVHDKRRRTDGAKDHWPVEVIAGDSLAPRRAPQSEEGEREVPSTPRIIENTRLVIKPMSIDEAALQLEDSADGVIVFRDAETDRLSVLYRRRDDHYGLIAPELDRH